MEDVVYAVGALLYFVVLFAACLHNRKLKHDKFLNISNFHYLGLFISNVVGAVSCKVQDMFYIEHSAAVSAKFWLTLSLYTILYEILYAKYLNKEYDKLSKGRVQSASFFNQSNALSIVVAMAIISFLSLFLLPPVPGLVIIVGKLGIAFGVVSFGLAYYVWARNRGDFTWFIVLLILAPYALYAATFGTSSRRPLLGIVFCVVVAEVLATAHGRSKVKKGIYLKLQVIAILGVIFIAAYGTVRHGLDGYMSGGKGVDKLSKISGGIKSFDSSSLSTLFNDNSVGVGHACAVYYSDVGRREFFHTPIFVATNFVPRVLWPDKPEALGATFPRDIGQWRYGYVNWGPGIVGHAYHNGGAFMVLFFAMAAAYFSARIDSRLFQWSYPPLESMFLAVALSHVVMFARGDIGIIVVELLMVYAAYKMTEICSKKFFLKKGVM